MGNSKMGIRIFILVLWAMSAVFAACSSQVTNKPDKPGLPSDSSSIFLQKSGASKADSTALSKVELTKIYAQAIADYIKAVDAKDKTVPDTLFFGKRAFGQPDDFPDIKLPKTIENTEIRLVSPEAGQAMQEARKSRVYINMIGWVDKKQAQFVLVTFSNGIEHKFDCYIDYKYNPSRNEFELEKLRFE